MTRPVVFICYSHKNVKDKDRLCSYLRVLENIELIEQWSDVCIKPGDQWELEIAKAIERAHVAILIITVEFFNSRYINEKEVPRLLERRRDGEVRIFPVIARDCPWPSVTWLAELEIRPKEAKDRPVWHSGGDPNRVLTALTHELEKLVRSEIILKPPVPPLVTSRPQRVTKQETSRKRAFWPSGTLQSRVLVLTVLTFILWIVAAGFTVRSSPIELSLGKFFVKVHASRFLSPNEPEELDFYIKNESNQLYAKFRLTSEGSGTVPCLVVKGNVYEGQVDEDERGNAAVICPGDMSGGINYLGKVAQLRLKVKTESGASDFKDLPMRVAPIPWIRWLRYISGLLLLVFCAFFVLVLALKAFARERKAAWM